MTYEQYQAICVETCHRIDERLRILDMSGDNPSMADLQRFVETVRERLGGYAAALDAYRGHKFDDAGETG